MDEPEGIFVEDMAGVATMLSAIIEADHKINDCQFVGKLEVVSGADEFGGTLVGWIQPYDDTWHFVPCIPQLHWSPMREEWVSLDEIRQENEDNRQGKPGDGTTAA
jgi:hypothetical protein